MRKCVHNYVMQLLISSVQKWNEELHSCFNQTGLAQLQAVREVIRTAQHHSDSFVLAPPQCPTICMVGGLIGIGCSQIILF